jgi:hypothetical protein
MNYSPDEIKIAAEQIGMKPGRDAGSLLNRLRKNRKEEKPDKTLPAPAAIHVHVVIDEGNIGLDMLCEHIADLVVAHGFGNGDDDAVKSVVLAALEPMPLRETPEETIKDLGERVVIMMLPVAEDQMLAAEYDDANSGDDR